MNPRRTLGSVLACSAMALLALGTLPTNAAGHSVEVQGPAHCLVLVLDTSPQGGPATAYVGCDGIGDAGVLYNCWVLYTGGALNVIPDVGC